MEATGFSSYGNSSRLGYAASELQQQGRAFVTRSHNMSTDRGLTGGPHIRKSRKMPRDFKSRGSNKIFTQELPKSIPQELSCKHLAHRASSKCMQRPVTKFTWTPEKTCTGSCKVVWGSPGSPLSLRQGAVQHHARTSEWFLPDVYKILARNLSKVMRCIAVSEDFTSIYKDLLIRTCKYKIIQERLRRFPQDQDLSKVFSQGPVQDHARISSRISVGSLRDFLSRIRTRSRRNLLQKVTALSTRSCHKVSTTRAKESDLTGSGMEAVVRWLHEQTQNSHRALVGAI